MPEKPLGPPATLEVKQTPPRKFFAFPSYFKKTKTRTVAGKIVDIIDLQEPFVSGQAKTQNSLETETRDTELEILTPPTPQLAYKMSLKKLQEPIRRPLIQVFLIHQLVIKVTLKLRSEGVFPKHLLQERKLPQARDSSLGIPVVRRRSYAIIQRRPLLPPYTPGHNGVSDKEDNMPLGFLPKEFLEPTTMSILTA